MTLQRLENESALDHKYRLLVEKAKGELEYGWDEITDELNLGISRDTIRKGSIFLPEFDEYLRNKLTGDNEELPQYKEVNEYKADGSHVSDKLIKLAEDDLKNTDKLLSAHGFNPSEWQLTGARNSLWNSNADKTLHSSRITVKPKVNGFDIDKVIEKINSIVEPVHIESKEQYRKGGLLEIPLVDMHWGVSDYDYYKETLDEIVELIKSKYWNTIYFNIGNDLLHTNTFDGKTANGTQIQQINLEQAWQDAFRFYSELLQVALESSINVNADYICGNHDKEITYGFVKALEVKFPQVKFDSTIKNKKLFVWNKVAIFSTHGDKGAPRLAKALLAEHGKTIALCDVVEIHTGHLHYSQSKDDQGIVVRTLPTKAITDDWHLENSFTGSQKTFQLFEYTQDKLKTIYHV